MTPQDNKPLMSMSPIELSMALNDEFMRTFSTGVVGSLLITCAVIVVAAVFLAGGDVIDCAMPFLVILLGGWLQHWGGKRHREIYREVKRRIRAQDNSVKKPRREAGTVERDAAPRHRMTT